MSAAWISLQGIPAEGREFSFADQQAWEARFREFKLDARMATPLVAEFSVRLQAGGALINGRLTGELLLRCSRCTAEVRHPVDISFDIFETPEGSDGIEGAIDGEGLEAAAEGHSNFVRREGAELALDPLEMLWEELSLEMPVKALCDQECKGLCAGCGRNLNKEGCTCQSQGSDPRMAPLRGLKLPKK